MAPIHPVGIRCLSPIFVQTAFKPEYNLNDYTVLFFEPDSAESRRAAESSMERTWPGVDQTKVPKEQELLQRYVTGLRGIAVDKMGFRSKFASTDVPMLAISGDHDISFSVDNWYPLIRNAPTLQLISMPDAPHFQYPELSVSYISANQCRSCRSSPRYRPNSRSISNFVLPLEARR